MKAALAALCGLAVGLLAGLLFASLTRTPSSIEEGLRQQLADREGELKSEREGAAAARAKLAANEAIEKTAVAPEQPPVPEGASFQGSIYDLEAAIKTEGLILDSPMARRGGAYEFKIVSEEQAMLRAVGTSNRIQLVTIAGQIRPFDAPSKSLEALLRAVFRWTGDQRDGDIYPFVLSSRQLRGAGVADAWEKLDLSCWVGDPFEIKHTSDDGYVSRYKFEHIYIRLRPQTAE
jgi:hypothetical protein